MMKNRRDSIFAAAIVAITIILFFLVFVLPNVQAQSLAVQTSPQVAITITTKTPVEVTVKGGPGNVRDYVALYLPGAQSYFVWQYLNGGKNESQRPKVGLKTAKLTFTVLKPGIYEARFYALTDKGVATLLWNEPFTVSLMPVETNGLGLVVTRKATNDIDQVSINYEKGSGTLVAPKDTKITVSAKAP